MYLRHVSVPVYHLQGAQCAMFRTCYQSVVGVVTGVSYIQKVQLVQFLKTYGQGISYIYKIHTM